MTDQPQSKMFQIWTPKIMLRLLGQEIPAERLEIRKHLIKYVDKRGLTLTDAATLNTFENSEALKKQIEKLVTPRPGERSNLEKILAMMTTLVQSHKEILEGQGQLAEQLAEIELRIAALNGVSPNQTSQDGLNGSR